MGWESALIIYIVMVVVLLAGGVWIGLVMGITGLVGITLSQGTLFWRSIGEIYWNTSNSFTLSAVPLFVLMGEIILRSGVSKRFYDGISVWLKSIPGGLLHSNIVGCAIFAAISGSSTATAVTIGTVAIPEMRSRGYDDQFLMGSLAGGGCLGILIPPSIVMIVYGAVVQESIASLFMAGVMPGLIITLLFMTYIVVRVACNPQLAPREKMETNVREMMVGLINCWPILALMAAILGGIYFGVVTPTEAGAVGCTGAVAIGLLFRDLSVKGLKEAIANAVATSCMMLFIILNAQILTFAIVNANIAHGFSTFLVGLGLEKWQFFILVCMMYAVMGCLVDGISMLLLTIPILYPTIKAMGFNGVLVRSRAGGDDRIRADHAAHGTESGGHPGHLGWAESRDGGQGRPAVHRPFGGHGVFTLHVSGNRPVSAQNNVSKLIEVIQGL